jgi:hypothetical protein
MGFIAIHGAIERHSVTLEGCFGVLPKRAIRRVECGV